MRRRVPVLVVALLAIALAGVVAALAARPVARVPSAVDPDVTIECTAFAVVDDAACLDWGDRILGGGAPTTTFEAEDLVRLRLDRSLFGFGGSCRAEWFLSRYPDDVAWAEEVACPS